MIDGAEDVAANEAPRPVGGIRVVDASRVLAAPFCASILADLGADVVHLEHPSANDEVRAWQPIVNGVSASFLAMNHSKKGLAVDLSRPEGIAILRRLLERADVFIENFRPGTMERYGLGFDAIRKFNPRLIYCAVRAFPAGCASEGMPGYEASTQAYTGVMSLTGEGSGDPVRCGPSVIDLGTGLSSVIAILSALLQRDRTGQGAYVEPSLIRTATNYLTYQISGYFMAGALPQRRGSGHEALVPYRVFNCSDGPIFIAGGNDRLWAVLVGVLGLAGAGGEVPYRLLAERIANRAEVDQLVSEAVGTWNRAELLAAFRASGLPAAPVNTIAEYVADPTLFEAHVLEEIEVPDAGRSVLAGPLFGADFLAPKRTAAPRLGEHTDEILSDIGFSPDDIVRMREERLVS
ncbi:CoA transferase [Agaricicola taiwanensis]|uniref:CoA transferase n=1 Tax=Agaricicola taiwanensis TaxID=591372 RepID=A0A8J2VMZ2_9RHOB|nr:CoA transferase [Agaricicola taiwanensis]GGE31684.1 CoA transferase [Agaricicola taiwanensis]